MRNTSWLLLVGSLTWAVPSAGQQPGGQPDPASPDPPALDPPPRPPRRADPLAEALAPHAGGLTPASVARRARIHSPEILERQAELDVADAQADQAFVGYFPTLTTVASYTRLSSVDNVTVLGPCPDAPQLSCVLRPDELEGAPLIPLATRTPLFLNIWSIVTTLTVPLSDYFVKIPQTHSAAEHTVEALAYEKQLQEAAIATNAKLALYAWVAAKGQLKVTELAVEQSTQHLEQAQALSGHGIGGTADTLLIESQLASAEQVRVEAETAVELTQEQLREVIGAGPDETFAIGFDLLATPIKATNKPLSALHKRALRQRLELRALLASQRSLEDLEDVASADYAPSLSAFANGYLRNPNPREIPQRAEWFFTWDAGVRLIWTVNDTFVTTARAAEVRARGRGLVARRTALKRAIRLEVAGAHADLKRAVATVASARPGLALATEALRAQEQLYDAGEANAVDILDAEAGLTRARFALLRGYIDYLIARARLAHAVGDDVRNVAPPT